MARIAVDVVLLPSEEMMDKAIEVNRELVKGFGERIILNKENCLPHISLAMGCIEEKDIPDIEKILQTVAKQYSFGQLRIIDIHSGTSSAGGTVSTFEIEKTNKLQLLHETVMEKLASYFSYDVNADMLFSPPEVKESSLLWIKNYPEKASFESFFPHITIGFGEINYIELPITFSARKLALCHLGNHCTCRRILASAELKS